MMGLGAVAKKKHRASTALSESAIMPTPERMQKAENFVHVSKTGTVTILDGSLARLVARGVVSDLQFYAGVRFHNIWHTAGLEPGPRSVDLNRVWSPDPFTFKPFPNSERQAEARHQYRTAVQHMGIRSSMVVEGVSCRGASLEDLGRGLGWDNRPQATAAATEILKDGLDRLISLWKLGGRT